MPKPSTADKRRVFRTLHERGCFVIPNPWNVGSALYLQGLGFKALATTSSGHAHSLGLPDGAESRDMVLAHYRELVAATDIPVNADFENGYAHDPADVAANVRLCVETGVAGLSIEDFTGDESAPLYDFDLALARVKAARQAIDQYGTDVVFTARTEGFLHGRADMDEAIRRLKAFRDAGADCLYVPGIKTREQIETVVRAVAPKPVNRRVVLANAASSGAGLEYAARHSDLIFVTSPAGTDPAAACAALPAHTARIKAMARAAGREVRILINPHVICRDTEAESQARYREIAAHVDKVALGNFFAGLMGGDNASWKGHRQDAMAVGGNVHLVGTPEQIVDWFARLKQAGCDGVQVNFFDYEPDLEHFAARVLPLMRQAGLRR